MSQRIMRLGFAAVSSLLIVSGFSGCSSHRQLATQDVDFNLTVEKAQNEMLLLNVIRAKDRLPMYMTGIVLMLSLSGVSLPVDSRMPVVPGSARKDRLMVSVVEAAMRPSGGVR